MNKSWTGGGSFADKSPTATSLGTDLSSSKSLSLTSSSVKGDLFLVFDFLVEQGMVNWFLALRPLNSVSLFGRATTGFGNEQDDANCKADSDFGRQSSSECCQLSLDRSDSGLNLVNSGARDWST